MTILWLDDLRNPYLNSEGLVPKVEGTLIWVRDFNEFTTWLLRNGVPAVVSFDHDLHPEHYTPPYLWADYQASKAYQDAKPYKERTGLDCAEWLVEFCKATNSTLPKWYVHSANPVGADYIRECLNKGL